MFVSCDLPRARFSQARRDFARLLTPATIESFSMVPSSVFQFTSIHFVILVNIAVGLATPADEPVTLANVDALATELGLDQDGRAGLNLPNEPIKEKFSLKAAKRFLDTSSLYWQKQRKCFTCHTNYPYLMARPLLGREDTAQRQVREFAEQVVTEQWPDKGPTFDAEVVSIAAGLAFNDSLGAGKLHAVTRQALDHMWTFQREDGSFDWIKANTAPSELDDHYGVTLALIGVGAAPNGYADTPAAQAGLEKLRRYLAKHPSAYLHQSVMLLWAASYVDGLMTSEDLRLRVDELLALQQEDGGWSLASLGNWKFHGAEGNTVVNSSDGYGTGLVTYVLRRAGVPADDPRIVQAIGWIKSNQRANGGWLTRSQSKAGGHHSISRAGSAYVIMALAACDQLRE